jgi:type IV secretory pathway ATPase VirB11/archaellum biosynthesis ATPase
MRALIERMTGERDRDACRCEATFEDRTLVVDAAACPGSGRLAGNADCRASVVERLRERDVETVVTRADGVERAYEGDAAALLVAAGRFADAVAVHDADLATRTLHDPLATAREAAGRVGTVADVVAETGLAEIATNTTGYAAGLAPAIGPVVARSRIERRPPTPASLADRRELATGAVARIYDEPAHERRLYHLEPVEHGLDDAASATVAAAYERLATGTVSGGKRAPARAVRQVATPDTPVRTLEQVLTKHTRGHGVLTDCFADPRLSDVFLTAPAADNRLRIRLGDETLRTNVRITERGAEALASRFRRESGRPFSRADATLDAATTIGDRRVRVAGVTGPVTDGIGFTFRAHDRQAWTLPALVANGTVPAAAAGLLSVAVERDAAILYTGSRGSGKTTMLGASLWELPAATRVLLVEDTPELPLESLQAADRDVQRLRTDLNDGPGIAPAEALRTALRLGDGALVLGEVRGEEAAVLYEAMRVGASDSAVLGTIHGDGGDDVLERVVTDLDVPASSFGATDLLVTLADADRADSGGRRVTAVEEVVHDERGVRFEPLFSTTDGALAATGRLAKGRSRLLADFIEPGGSYEAVRSTVRERGEWLADLGASGRTDPAAVVAAHADRREERG